MEFPPVLMVACHPNVQADHYVFELSTVDGLPILQTMLETHSAHLDLFCRADSYT